jgi:hypothetical protein
MSLVAGWKVLGPEPATEPAPGVMWQPPPGRPVLRRATDPRAYLVSSTEKVDDWRAAVQRMAAGHDVHRSALVETDLAVSGGAPDAGRAEIVSFAPERIELEVQAPAPVLLVVAEAWYPGWSATVDGAAAPCVPANAWMRAVPVSAGAHRVVLRYRSRWLLPGALLFLLTAAGLVVLARRERRGSDRAEGPPGDEGEAGHDHEKPDPQEKGVAL